MNHDHQPAQRISGQHDAHRSLTTATYQAALITSDHQIDKYQQAAMQLAVANHIHNHPAGRVATHCK